MRPTVTGARGVVAVTDGGRPALVLNFVIFCHPSRGLGTGYPTGALSRSGMPCSCARGGHRYLRFCGVLLEVSARGRRFYDFKEFFLGGLQLCAIGLLRARGFNRSFGQDKAIFTLGYGTQFYSNGGLYLSTRDGRRINGL